MEPESPSLPEPQAPPALPLRPARIPPPTIHIVRFVVLGIMVGFGLHLLLPQIAGLQDSVDHVRRLPPGLVILAALMQLGNYGGTGLMMGALVKMVGGRLDIARGAIISVAAASVGLITGGTVGNSAVTYRWVRGSGVRRLGAALCATLPLLLIHLALLLVSLIGLVSLFFIHQLTAIEVAGFAVVLVLLVAIIGLALYGMARPARLIDLATPWFARYHTWRGQPFDPRDVAGHVDQLVNVALVLRRRWGGPALGAVVNLAADVTTLYLLFLATGYRVPVGVLLAGYGLPLLVGRLPLVPGGVGVVEATMTAIFASFGAPARATLIAVLGYRLFSFWLPTLLGFPLALYLQRVTRQPADAPNVTT